MCSAISLSLVDTAIHFSYREVKYILHMPLRYISNKKTGKKYAVNGCLRDPLKHELHHQNSPRSYSEHSQYNKQSLPSAVDLRRRMTPVEDQTETNSW